MYKMTKITVMSIDDPRDEPILKRCHNKGGVMVRHKCVKSGAKLNYKESDFNILKGLKETSDPRIPFLFKSKDGEIEANVFNEPGNVEIRALVGDNSNRGSIRLVYPFSYRPDPDEKQFLKSFIHSLNRGDLKVWD